MTLLPFQLQIDRAIDRGEDQRIECQQGKPFPEPELNGSDGFNCRELDELIVDLRSKERARSPEGREAEDAKREAEGVEQENLTVPLRRAIALDDYRKESSPDFDIVRIS